MGAPTDFAQRATARAVMRQTRSARKDDTRVIYVADFNFGSYE